MNMYEAQSALEEEKIKMKKLIKIIALALVMLFVLCIFIILYISYLQNKQLKLFVDNAEIQLTPDMIIIDENNTIYVSLSDIADKIGYTMNNGEYKNQYSEDATKCYLKNKYEVTSYIGASNEIYKTIIPENKLSDVDYDYYIIDQQVFLQNNKLYTSLNGLEIGCNLSCSYTKQNNTINIYTLEYLTTLFSTKIAGAKYLTEQEDLNTYENKKAILHDMIVVKNEDGKYGVTNLNNSAIIGQKYKSVKFIEAMQEFIVETEDGKYGIIDKEGKTKISPDYTSIKQIDKEKALYMVSKNSYATSGRTQYGIINENEKIVVYLEYDQIGINKADFPTDNIDNSYILYGKCIPVKKSNKWGLLDINGNMILPIEYDDLGCKSNISQDIRANSLLLVPEYEAIVVCKDKLYGLFDVSGRKLIEPLCTDMYGINSSGENKYYLTYIGNTMDIITYLKDIGIEPVVKNDNEENNINSFENNSQEENTNNNQDTNDVNTNQNASNIQNENNENANNVQSIKNNSIVAN